MLVEINGELIDIADDSKMPSTEESKKIVIPPELKEKLREDHDKIAHEFGLY